MNVFVPQGLRSHVVYKFTCAGCNASYIGKTTRHTWISSRVCEHLVSEKASHVYNHLASSNPCLDSCSSESFKILDSANSCFKITAVKYKKLCISNGTNLLLTNSYNTLAYLFQFSLVGYSVLSYNKLFLQFFFFNGFVTTISI